MYGTISFLRNNFPGGSGAAPASFLPPSSELAPQGPQCVPDFLFKVIWVPRIAEAATCGHNLLYCKHTRSDSLILPNISPGIGVAPVWLLILF